jgi:hypothetical protein
MGKGFFEGEMSEERRRRRFSGIFALIAARGLVLEKGVLPEASGKDLPRNLSRKPSKTLSREEVRIRSSLKGKVFLQQLCVSG